MTEDFFLLMWEGFFVFVFKELSQKSIQNATTFLRIKLPLTRNTWLGVWRREGGDDLGDVLSVAVNLPSCKVAKKWLLKEKEQVVG